MRWFWVSSGSYSNILRYFEYFLIFQVVECTLGGAGRALDQVIAQSTATTSTQPTPLMHTKHHAHYAYYAHQAPCTLPSTHMPTPPPSKPSTQPPLPQLLFLPCNAMACIATLNPAPKPFQFHPKPYSCLECRHKCESKRMRE